MLTRISNFYKESFLLHGPSPSGVGWKDKESQELRFLQLSQVISEQDRKTGLTVNDFGCGYGSLFEYLSRKMIVTKYTGYDVCPEMIEFAKRQYPFSRDLFIQSSKVEYISDYSFASGTFTVKVDSTENFWTDYVKTTLIEMSKKSKKGFAFNALSTYIDWKSNDTYYADPLVFFSFCKRHISKYVSLIHDYPLFEWTMIIKKEDYINEMEEIR